MFDNHGLLVQIEAAERDTPYCSCGEPMVPVGAGDGIWLECRSLVAPKAGRMAGLLSWLTPHDRQLLVEWVADAA
jgi:hypothetical protein